MPGSMLVVQRTRKLVEERNAGHATLCGHVIDPITIYFRFFHVSHQTELASVSTCRQLKFFLELNPYTRQSFLQSSPMDVGLRIIEREEGGRARSSDHGGEV